MQEIKYFMNVWKENQKELLLEADRLIFKYDLFKNSCLMDHQKQGVRLMISFYMGGRNAYLADEMGLGKTLQCIKIIQFYFKNTANFNKRQCLIIAPSTLQNNWMNELSTHLPGQTKMMFSSSESDRKLFKKALRDKFPKILVISNRMCLFQKMILKKKYGIVILDQAQSAKNIVSRLSQLMVKKFSKMNILVSGTPLSNSLQQVVNQLVLLQPGLFQSLPPMNVVEMKQIVQFFLIRRTKSQIQAILTLPAKQEIVLYLSLTPIQKQTYQRITVNQHQKLENYSQNTVMNLLRVCDHPNLDKICKTDNVSLNQLMQPSSKMIQLSKILKKHISKKQRVIIFVSLLKTIELISKFCQIKKYSYSILNGKISTQTKEQVLKHYHKNHVDVFIATTKCGGTGLTLTQANVVVLFNTSWNPQIDKQAIDRAHRVGQKKDVTIYRFICQGTIQEKIMSFQKNKLELQQQLIKVNKHEIKFQKNLRIQNEIFEPEYSEWAPKVYHKPSLNLDTKIMFRNNKQGVDNNSKQTDKMKFNIVTCQQTSQQEQEQDFCF